MITNLTKVFVTLTALTLLLTSSSCSTTKQNSTLNLDVVVYFLEPEGHSHGVPYSVSPATMIDNLNIKYLSKMNIKARLVNVTLLKNEELFCLVDNRPDYDSVVMQEFSKLTQEGKLVIIIGKRDQYINGVASDNIFIVTEPRVYTDTIIHEFGHAFGLEHVNNFFNYLYPYGLPTRCFYTPEQIVTIRENVKILDSKNKNKIVW